MRPVIVIAQGAGGDSGSVFFLVMAVVGLLAVGLFVLVLRARKPEQSRSPRQDADRPVEIGGKGESGRPLHKDPDPDRLAGGRASFTPPD